MPGEKPLSVRAMVQRARDTYLSRYRWRRTTPARTMREAWETLKNETFLGTAEYRRTRWLVRNPENPALSEVMAKELEKLAEARGIPLIVKPVDEWSISYGHLTADRWLSDAEDQAIEQLVSAAYTRALQKLRQAEGSPPPVH